MKKLFVLLVFLATASLWAQTPNYPYTTLIVPQVLIPGNCTGKVVAADGTGCVSGGGSGTVSGQANGVIPLATASTTIGAQSALSDNGTTVTSTEPLAAPSVVTGTPTTAAKAALPTGSHGFSCDESPTQFVPAPGVDGFACDSVSHQLLFSSNNSPLAPMAVASPVWPITTPTVTCYGGTPANVTSSLSVGTDGGKTRLVSLLITVTNIGSCNSIGAFGLTLPFTAQTGAVLSCRENTAGASGYGLVNASSASLAVGPFQGLGQSWGVNGYSVLCSGAVQSQ